MRSRRVLVILAIVALVLTIANSVLMVSDAFFYSINDLPQGTFVRMATRNVGTEEERSVSVYKVENSLGTAVLCTATTPDGEERNIYWQVGVEDVDIEWVNANTVMIRAEGVEDVGLNIDIDYYDCRTVIEETIPIVEMVKSR